MSVLRHSGPVLITKHCGTCENSSLHINQVLHYVPFNCWLMRVSNQPYSSNLVHFRHEELINKNLLQFKVSIRMRKRSGGDTETGLKTLSWWEGDSDSISTCYNKRCAEEHLRSHNILNVGADGLQWQGTTWVSQLSVKKGEIEANWTTEEIWGEGELACLITTCYIHGVQNSISEPNTC